MAHQAPIVFGHLTLVPVTQPLALSRRIVPQTEVTILWKLQPRHSFSFLENKKIVTAEADPAGMWRVPGNVEGKICIAH